MKYRVRLSALIVFVLFVAATSTRITREQYIRIYHKVAQEKMKEHGIPASITLAQGILESDCGNSSLAKKANNHFGIKCHDWKGSSVKYNDDKRNECFRKYKNAAESFEDHSEFLTGRGRYESLFSLKSTDYKGWAKGLKKAGYATDPHYADRLIKIIEEEALFKYDVKFEGTPDLNAPPGIVREMFYNNNTRYVIAKEGETLVSLSQEFGMRLWELPRYNDMPKASKLNEGDVIYVRPKRVKSSKEVKFHKVLQGESMHSISQKYGIKLSSLYWKNRMEKGTRPKVGQVIFLQYRKPKDLN